PEIDYEALIRAAFAKDKKWAQGTNGCIAFARGAEWFREVMLAATPAAPSQEPVTLTDAWLLEQFKHHPNWELSTSNDPECDPSVFWLVHEVKGGRNDREWFLIGEGESPRAAIIAALREKGGT
ncbi:MAG TPA: hypothetical protein VFM10_12850, partial [Terriglobales bacterium]|nr:hypothetical protein [Terriglobales bacterium]